MQSSEKAYDDLTAITGIGPARQRWLRESLNVRTYADLAALSVDQIESQLKAEGKIFSRNDIISWLLRAQELSATPGRITEQEVEPEDKAAKDALLPTRKDGWKQFATFVVEFQTRDVVGQAQERRTAVHHMEEDTGMYWPGIERKKLCEWMLDQIRDRVDLEPEEYGLTEAHPAETPSAAVPSAKVQITQIRVFQPYQSETPTQTFEPSKPFQGFLKGDEPFNFEVVFELTGPAAADIASKRVECSAQSYAYDQAKETSIPLGNTGTKTFEKGRLAYTFTLPKATLPKGNYRLWVLVTPRAAQAIPDFLEVPVFQVV